MASQSSNHSGSRETRRETLHAPKTPGRRGGKLLDDAQKGAKATSGQNLGWLLLGGEDNRDPGYNHQTSPNTVSRDGANFG